MQGSFLTTTGNMSSESFDLQVNFQLGFNYSLKLAIKLTSGAAREQSTTIKNEEGTFTEMSSITLHISVWVYSYKKTLSYAGIS